MALVAHVLGALLLESRMSPRTSSTSFKDGALRGRGRFLLCTLGRWAWGHLRNVLKKRRAGYEQILAYTSLTDETGLETKSPRAALVNRYWRYGGRDHQFAEEAEPG